MGGICSKKNKHKTAEIAPLPGSQLVNEEKPASKDSQKQGFLLLNFCQKFIFLLLKATESKSKKGNTATQSTKTKSKSKTGQTDQNGNFHALLFFFFNIYLLWNKRTKTIPSGNHQGPPRIKDYRNDDPT